jgi:hypothetical protein
MNLKFVLLLCYYLSSVTKTCKDYNNSAVYESFNQYLTIGFPCNSLYQRSVSVGIKADSHIACCAHAVPLPCSDSAVSFVKVRVVARRSRTLASSPQAVSRRTCCAVPFRRTAWAWHGKCESDTAALCKLNGKKQSKPLAARHGLSMLCVIRP